MTPQEYFQKAREKKNISIRALAKECNISQTNIVYLLAGKKDFQSVHFSIILKLFSLLDISISDFYETFFPEIKKSVIDNVAVWKENNKTELNYEVLKKRIYNRLLQIRHRNRLDLVIFNTLFDEYNEVFIKLANNVDKKGCIDQISYDEYISPLLYHINTDMDKVDEDKINSPNAIYINDLVNQSEYSYLDIGSFIGISQRRLLMLRVSEEGFISLKTSNFLKLCYVLNIDIDFFVSNKI